MPPCNKKRTISIDVEDHDAKIAKVSKTVVREETESDEDKGTDAKSVTFQLRLSK